MHLKTLFRPHRTVPKTSWTAPNQWSLTPLRAGILIFGLSIFGFGEALLIQSTLGNSPWAVLSQGLSRHTPLSLGWSTFAISIVVLLLWIPLKQRPGLGTITNIIVIAFMLQIGTDILHHLWAGTRSARWIDDRSASNYKCSSWTGSIGARNFSLGAGLDFWRTTRYRHIVLCTLYR